MYMEQQFACPQVMHTPANHNLWPTLPRHRGIHTWGTICPWEDEPEVKEAHAAPGSRLGTFSTENSTSLVMCLWCLSVTCRVVCVSLVSENKTGHLSSREEKSTFSLQKREEENGKGEKHNIYCQKVMVEPSTDWDREMLLFSDFFFPDCVIENMDYFLLFLLFPNKF